MDAFTKRAIYIIMGITLALVILGFAATVIKIAWADGNTPLVTSVTTSLSNTLITIVGAIAVMITGQNISSALMNRPASTQTTVTTSPTPGTTTIVSKIPTVINTGETDGQAGTNQTA